MTQRDRFMMQQVWIAMNSSKQEQVREVPSLGALASTPLERLSGVPSQEGAQAGKALSLAGLRIS